jgi:hypothetical protein
MMSVETLQAQNRAWAARAARDDVTPVLAWPEDVGSLDFLAQIPALGDYVPEGWTLVREHFVDSTGMGYEWEPALTVGAFAASLTPGHGYAIVSAGQFQVYVGEYTPPA